jgi:hypothetical protein
MLQGLVIVAVLLAASLHARAADTSAMVTILEGDAQVYRGAGRVYAAEGMKLTQGDIIETGPSTFVQIELPEQAVVQFGPSTRAMLGAGGKQKSDRWIYVMDGWTKVTGAKAQADSPGLRTRSFWMEGTPSVVVFRQSPAETTLFVERGETRLNEHQASGNPVGVPLKQGDYYQRKTGARGVVLNASAMQGFIGEMPRSFRDSLPLRAERFRDQEVKLKDAPAFAYADVEAWLKAEPSIRKPLMQRWRSKAREPAFRTALIENLSAHPEWDPILFLEKYLPKEPKRATTPTANPSTAAASSAASSSPR